MLLLNTRYVKKGYSKDTRLTNLFGAFWAWVAARSLHVTFVRVSSKSNLSDAVSRGDWSPSDGLGCSQVHAQFEKVWDLALKMASSAELATAEGFQQLVDLLAFDQFAESLPRANVAGAAREWQ